MFQVAILFREHHDLLDEFSHFLPDTSQPGRSCTLRRDDRGSPIRMANPMHVEKVV